MMLALFALSTAHISAADRAAFSPRRWFHAKWSYRECAYTSHVV